MGAATLNLRAEQGADFYLKLKFQDDSETPVVEDLTGQTFRGQVRKQISDSDPVCSFTFTILNQTTNRGEVEVTISAATLAALSLKAQKVQARTVEDFCYDIERVLTTGKIHRVLEGLFQISPEVTR